MKHQAKSLRSSFGRIPKGSPLSALAVNTVDEWFDAKHRKPCLDEDVLANSLSVQSCPCRGSQDIIRNGKRKDGIQTYLCLRSGHKFNPLSGTPFDSHKIPVSEWTEFLIRLFQHQSVLCSSLDNRNAHNTGRYWLGKVFLVLEDYPKDIRLYGDVGVDERFLSNKPNGPVLHGDGKRMRGLSRSRHCIYCATDRESAVLIDEGYGNPSKAGEPRAVVPHMENATSFHDDGEAAHGAIEKTLGIPRKVYPSTEMKGLKDAKSPLRDIDAVHREFELLANAHGAYGRKNIQGSCNLESFMHARHGDKVEMVLDMLEMCLRCRKVLRYRKVFLKKANVFPKMPL